MSEFVKEDDGKLRISLIEPQFIKGTAKVLTMGCNLMFLDAFDREGK